MGEIRVGQPPRTTYANHRPAVTPHFPQKSSPPPTTPPAFTDAPTTIVLLPVFNFGNKCIYDQFHRFPDTSNQNYLTF